MVNAGHNQDCEVVDAGHDQDCEASFLCIDAYQLSSRSSECLDLQNLVVIGTISSLVAKIPIMHYFASLRLYNVHAMISRSYPYIWRYILYSIQLL